MGYFNESPGRRSSTRVFLSAAEAYPALEEAFLDAKKQIVASFAVFDLTTRLRSDRAKAIGLTWAQLLAHTLGRGVAISMTISDFDPISRTDAHRASWASVRQFKAVSASMTDANLTVHAMRHDSETGIWPRLGLWPLVLQKQLRAARWLNGQSAGDRDAAMADMPGLRHSLTRRRSGRMRPCLWPVPPMYPGTHHQKLAVFDSRVLYIGGLDVRDCRIDGPRQERSRHELHDVQLMMKGPIVAEAEAHLGSFLNVVSGAAKPPSTRRLLRTLSCKRLSNSSFFGPQPLVQDIAAAHEAMVRRTRHLIYLETRHVGDRNLVQKLEQAARENPDLSMILILPVGLEEQLGSGKKMLDARYCDYVQKRALRRLIRAFGPRLFIGGAARSTVADGGASDSALPIHVPASVSIFDDHAAIVSSANLSGRSLRWDTEAGVLLNTPHEMADLRMRVMAHWLPADAGAEYFAVKTAASAWRDLACDNAKRAPGQRLGQIVPYDMGDQGILGRLPWPFTTRDDYAASIMEL